MKECEHCGVYCPWDNESEWQEEWNQWQQRLAYYDRTHGELYNEWCVVQRLFRGLAPAATSWRGRTGQGH